MDISVLQSHVIISNGLIHYWYLRFRAFLVSFKENGSQSHPPHLICSHSELMACLYIYKFDGHHHFGFAQMFIECPLHATTVAKHWGNCSVMTDCGLLGTQSGWRQWGKSPVINKNLNKWTREFQVVINAVGKKNQTQVLWSGVCVGCHLYGDQRQPLLGNWAVLGGMFQNR